MHRRQSPKIIDAEFEVIQPPGAARRGNGDHFIRWLWFAFLLLIAGFTLLMGLLGADLDTNDTGNATHMYPADPPPAEAIPIPPVPSALPAR